MSTLKTAHRLKLPFRDYKPAFPEMLQAVLMVAVAFSAAPVLTEQLGMTQGEALTCIAIAEALGVLHVTLGDPVVPGWIASALTLVLAYLGKSEAGLESVHAIIALQLLVGGLFVVLGATGLAKKLMSRIPAAIKAGILLGAGFSALGRIFGSEGYLSQYPISVGVGGAVTLLVLYSKGFKKGARQSQVVAQIAKYGMLPGLVAAMIAGFASGELALPTIQGGFIPFSFGSLFHNYSVFSIGLPSLGVFLSALPTAIAVYIIAFGEIVTSESVLTDAKAARPDENVAFSVNRTNVIAGIRNIILALFAPFPSLAGPLWTAVTVSICQRYKEGPRAMKTLFSGTGSFKVVTALCVLLMPLASLLQPVLPVALAVTLLVQGFACSYIAIGQVKDDVTSAGIAGVMGGVCFLKNLNWALAVGVALVVLLQWAPQRKIVYLPSFGRKNGMKIDLNRLVITVDQQAAAGGDLVAEALAAKLHIPCYASRLNGVASKQSGISEALLQRYDERPVLVAYDLKAADESGIHMPRAAAFLAARRNAALELADRQSCIIVDRHASGVLFGHENCVSVYIHASDDERLDRLCREQALTPDAARAALRRADRKRIRYYRGSNPHWGKAAFYDMTVDASGRSAEEVAVSILRYLADVTHQPELMAASGM